MVGKTASPTPAGRAAEPWSEERPRAEGTPHHAGSGLPEGKIPDSPEATKMDGRCQRDSWASTVDELTLSALDGIQGRSLLPFRHGEGHVRGE